MRRRFHRLKVAPVALRPVCLADSPRSARRATLRLAGLLVAAQTVLGTTLEVTVRHTLAGQPLQLDASQFQSSAGERFSVTRVSYLLSGFALEHNDGSWLELTNTIAWMDAEKSRSSLRLTDIPSGAYRSIRFHFGPDSVLNHADPAKFSADHPLNPNLNGLHWNWQGGYIFLAFEGMWASNAAHASHSIPLDEREGRAALSSARRAAHSQSETVVGKAPRRAEDSVALPPHIGSSPQDQNLDSRNPVEGRGKSETAVVSGFSYHFARDTNRTRINLAAPLDLTRDTRMELDFDLAALLNAPRPISFVKDGSSTHSREGDPIAASLAANLPGAIRVRQVTAMEMASAPAGAIRPLYLPEKFTPYRFTMSAVFPIPDLPRDNPLIEERIALGEKLFHEPLLSRDGTLSCASCHDAKAAFSDPRRYSIGVRNQSGTRQAMPLFNLAWKNSFFWDGRAPSLRAQALMPIQDHIEMDESLSNVVAKLNAASSDQVPVPLTPALSPGERENGTQSSGKRTPSAGQGLSDSPPLPKGEGRGEGKRPQNRTGREISTASSQIDYRELFKAAFGSTEIRPEKIGLAIESFVLTLTSFDSRFDRAFRGEAPLTDEEKRGFELFMTEYDPRRGQFGADCFHCHGGALFQSQSFANNGLDAQFTDPGRAKVTGRNSDEGKFSTPSLRNIALTAPYMHDGRFATLDEVVEHYSTGVKRSATLDPNLAKHPDGGLNLSREDQRALVAFLRTLTDEKFRAGEVKRAALP